MGFLEDIKTNEVKTLEPKIINKNKGFLDDVVLPKNSIQAERNSAMRNSIQALETESKRASSFGGMLKETITGIPKAAKDVYAPAFKPLVDVAKNTWETYKQTPEKLKQDLEEASKNISKGNLSDFFGINTGSGILGIGGQTGKGLEKAAFRTTADVMNVIYAPLSAVIGSVLEQSGGQKLTDKLGQVIADKSGITDLPAFQKFAVEHPNAGEDFNRLLILGLSAGEKGMIEPKRMVTEFENVVNKIIKQTEKTPEVKPIENIRQPEQIKELTPAEKYSNYAKKQGYEPYQSQASLPTIDFGPKAKEALPTIQMYNSKAKYGKLMPADYVYEPIKETPMPEVKIQRIEPKIIDMPEYRAPIRPQEVMGLKTSKVAKSIEAKVIENGLTEGFNKVAGYDPITIKDQAMRATNLIERDLDLAKKMVKGEVPMEAGLKGEMLIKAMEDYAQATKNVQLSLDIANSPLVSETSAHAQAMRILAERNPDSVVANLREIKRLREEKIVKKSSRKIEQVKKTTYNEVKNEVNKKSMTRQTWSEFVEQIKCNY